MNRHLERGIFISAIAILAILLVRTHLNALANARPTVSIEGTPIATPYTLEQGPLRPDGVIAFFSKSPYRSARNSLLLDFYHQKLRQAIIRSAKERNYQVATFAWDGEDDGLSEAEKLRFLISETSEIEQVPLVGVILTPVNSYAYDAAVDAINPFGEKVPIVTVDTPLDTFAAKQILAHVTIDNRAAAKLVATFALNRLIEAGDTEGDVIIIAGPSTQANSNERLIGFNEAILEAETKSGIEFNEMIVANGDWTTTFGRETLNWYRTLRPVSAISAIISSNDNMALGAAIELSSREIPLPLITGIDANQNAQISIAREQLTATVPQPADEVGRRAVEVLLDYAEDGREPEAKEVIVPFGDLIYR